MLATTSVTRFITELAAMHKLECSAASSDHSSSSGPEKRIAGRFLAFALLAVGILSCALGLLNADKLGGSQDFQWGESRLLLEHENPLRLFAEGKFKYDPLHGLSAPAYPMSALVFLWPVAAIDFNHAKGVWAVANILFAIGSVVLVGRMLDLGGVVLAGLLGIFLASTPVRNTIGNGQQGLFSLFFFLLAVSFQQRNKTPLAALCLAASWLKYTITFPLSLVFLRREWRQTLAIAVLVHIGLTIFLGFWTDDNVLSLFLGPLMQAQDIVSATMFDLMAVAKYIGMPSLTGAMIVSIALFVLLAVLLVNSTSDLVADLSLLSVVSLIWAYHWPYDYFVLIIPLGYALKHWQKGKVDLAGAAIALVVLLVWFVQRVLDAAVLSFPSSLSIAVARQIVFWLACLAIYLALASDLRRRLQLRLGMIVQRG
jgi:hypothetical protein